MRTTSTCFLLVLFLFCLLAPATGQAGRVGLAKSGQTFSDLGGDDGDTQNGVAWPNPRFTIHTDGTVSDNLTGLMWLQDSQCLGRIGDVNEGISWSRNLVTGDDYALGAGGLIEAFNNATITKNCINYPRGTYDDWRMPNIREMLSLITYYAVYPAIPNTWGTGKMTLQAQPFYFNRDESPDFWTSTTFVDDSLGFLSTDDAYFVNLVTGQVSHTSKTGNTFEVWPVRGTASGGGAVIIMP